MKSHGFHASSHSSTSSLEPMLGRMNQGTVYMDSEEQDGGPSRPRLILKKAEQRGRHEDGTHKPLLVRRNL